MFLREHEGAVEADLHRWYGIDYRDRWRFDSDGRRKLTLRMISVRLAHLPAESATAQLHPNHSPWRLEHHLLDDVRMAIHQFAGVKNVKPHPTRTAAKVVQIDPVRRRKLDAARARARQRRRDIEAGVIQ